MVLLSSEHQRSSHSGDLFVEAAVDAILEKKARPTYDGYHHQAFRNLDCTDATVGEVDGKGGGGWMA